MSKQPEWMVVKGAYAKSLFWTALFMALSASATNITSLILIDFVHGNPHRPQSNAIWMMAVFTPLAAAVAFSGTILIFGIPQMLQALLVRYLRWTSFRIANFCLLAALPLTAIVTWYSYDYLTPTDCNLAINTPADWEPYRHGLTMPRYLKTLAFQTPITLFTVLYVDASVTRYSKVGVLFPALVVAVLSGVVWGRVLAQGQYQFL